MYSESLNKGQDYRELPNVIAINIVDFDFPPGGNVHTCFHLREDADPALNLTDALEIHFINMVKWRKQAGRDIKNPLHRWLVWLDENSPPELVEEVACMDSAIKAANDRQYYLTQDWQERNLYTHRLMAIMDYNSGVSYAREEGLQEGERTGEEKKAVEIARKALAEKLPVDVIQKITGLDMETIHVIAKT